VEEEGKTGTQSKMSRSLNSNNVVEPRLRGGEEVRNRKVDGKNLTLWDTTIERVDGTHTL
jgi:hypothetical protein